MTKQAQNKSSIPTKITQKHKQQILMEFRKFEIIIVSADNLPRSFGRMRVYAEVSISGEPNTSKQTTVDLAGQTNPRWNFSLDYTFEEASLQKSELVVKVKLYCERTLGDKVKNVLTYTVDGAGEGKVNITYCFGNTFMAPKPSVWKKALRVMVQGTWFLLSADIGDW
ncbi:hypothetical protein SASPL_148105 [Salvia splendens]|uniref:C2 domain-containing protein n=1 Tax=Salvia splendens TaxID=180675 RepID=A0A8X8Z3D1_SALSN|nr:hypothetical protein SASPL_148105 [Salvia splendens]